ncbi:hypothetical protein O6P43_001616 [Quillaja saponaria]|uniref:Uncharacterized protein n=1 Tax=Quillaja saponaria TaxID=32244 RepID=A0AAD7QJ63_QUISA|nr:hypothetical protein O6P43_001616 [Quillaja saponaria]
MVITMSHLAKNPDEDLDTFKVKKVGIYLKQMQQKEWDKMISLGAVIDIRGRNDTLISFSSNCSLASDIYSFGAVLMGLIAKRLFGEDYSEIKEQAVIFWAMSEYRSMLGSDFNLALCCSFSLFVYKEFEALLQGVEG